MECTVYLPIIVDPSRLFHQLSVGVLEPPSDIDEQQHKVTDIEGKDHGEACPSNRIVHLNIIIKSLWVVDDDLVDDERVDHDTEEEK